MSLDAADNLDIALIIGNERVGTLCADHKEPLTKQAFGNLVQNALTPKSGYQHQPLSYEFFRVTAPDGTKQFFDKNRYIQTVNPDRTQNFAQQRIPGAQHAPALIESFWVQPKIEGLTDDVPYIAHRTQVFGAQAASTLARRRSSAEIAASREGMIKKRN